MATPAPSKYALKSLHDEIALFDRKLAHLEKYETFPSEKERLATQAKMSIKRGQLVRAAQAMTDAGIEYQPTEVPHPSRLSQAAEDLAVPDTAYEAANTANEFNESHAGARESILDFRNSIGEYKKRRKLVLQA